jgi:hypothetical protein
MDIASGTDRVRVYEPAPNVPSGSEPVFAGYLRQLTTATALRIGLSGVLVAFGVVLVLTERRGSALAYVYFAVFGSSLAMWSYVLVLQRQLVVMW